jgi:hypothetical protein
MQRGILWLASLGSAPLVGLRCRHVVMDICLAMHNFPLQDTFPPFLYLAVALVSSAIT